jgi:hypothetical protein
LADIRGRQAPGSWRYAADPVGASHSKRRRAMGKYLLAWLLGVPALVLVVIYIFFH